MCELSMRTPIPNWRLRDRIHGCPLSETW